MQGNPTNQLHIIVAHSERALTSFPDCSKGIWQDIIQAFALRQTRPKLGRLSLQSLIAERFKLTFELIDLPNQRVKFF